MNKKELTPEQEQQLTTAVQAIWQKYEPLLKELKDQAQLDTNTFYIERGYPCLIRKMETGHLTGYVGIPREQAQVYYENKTTSVSGIEITIPYNIKYCADTCTYFFK